MACVLRIKESLLEQVILRSTILFLKSSSLLHYIRDLYKIPAHVLDYIRVLYKILTYVLDYIKNLYKTLAYVLD